MQGTRIGKYEILDKLGEGGMGEVWRARDDSLNRTVAVKILPVELSRDSGRRLRFEQEARTLGALNHPNNVAVYEAGQDDGRAYLISELVDGESMRAILDRGRPPLRKLIEMAVQIAEAMAAAHRVGIIHRDLKPENIMVTRNGLVKVLDFGLAKQTVVAGDATAAMTMTQPGMVMGTAGYMSPEQVRGEPTDHRSDIFSFGAVLYEMITGKRAFQAGTSAVETMNAILHEDPPAIEADFVRCAARTRNRGAAVSGEAARRSLSIRGGLGLRHRAQRRVRCAVSGAAVADRSLAVAARYRPHGVGCRCRSTRRRVLFGTCASRREPPASSASPSATGWSGKTRFLGAVSGQTSDLADPVLAWTPNSKEIWFRPFDLSEWGTIYAMNLKGQRRIVARVPSHVALYDIGRDGGALLRTDTRQVGILGKAKGDTIERDLSIMDASNLESISDDGSAIVANIVGEAEGRMGSVYLRKLDGSPAIRLGAGAAFLLSPDGKWVSGYSSKDGLIRQYKLFPTGTGEEQTIAIRELDWGFVVGWLPGDRKYLVAGARHGKKENCFAWDASSSSLRSICPEGIPDNVLPLSPDRQWVLSGGPDGQTYAYPIAGGTPRLVRGLSLHDEPIGWRADNRSLYLVMHHDTNRVLPVSVLDIESGKRMPWMEIRPTRPVDEVVNLQITPHGEAYAYSFRVKVADLYVATGLQ
jgi:serine/threonine protein kinase